MSLTASAPPDLDVLTDPRKQRQVLITVLLALVTVVASVSGLNVAQQSLAADLGASQSTLLWMINGYTVTLAALLLPLGAVGDRWGRKWLLVGGLVVFGAASLVAAFADTSAVVVAARVVAGAGAALIMPVTLSTITSSFPPDKKAGAVGIWSGFAAAGGIIGLVVSAFIVDAVSWRWVFAMPIALSAVAVVCTLLFISNTREHQVGRFDLTGSVLSVVGIGALVLGIHEGPDKGWSDPLAIAGVGIGVVALLAFAVWELRHPNPLLNIRVFRNRSLAAGSVTLLAVFGAMFGLFLLLVQFLQAVLGYTAIRSTSGLLPMAAMMMGFSSFAPKLITRLGTRRVLLLGLSVFMLALVLLAVLASSDGGYLSLLPGLLLGGAGLGLSMTPATTAITGALPEDEQGVASALNDTMRELGGAVGVALLGSILNSGYRTGVSDLEGTLPAAAYEPIREGIGGALAVAGAPTTSAEAAATILSTAREAFIDGWAVSMWVGVAMGAAALLFVIFRGPRDDVDEYREAVVDVSTSDAIDEPNGVSVVPA